MNNQKKIEEILYSIQELILEAQNEKKLDLVETKQVIELDKINPSKTDNLENNQDYTESYVNKLIKTEEFKNTKLEGKFLGKTGTLSNVFALSGYLYKDNKPLIVSIIQNSEMIDKEKTFNLLKNIYELEKCI